MMERIRLQLEAWKEKLTLKPYGAKAMTAGTTTKQQPATTDKKRKRLTLEEQIARQEELLTKDKESLAKKQQRLRSLNAAKMNKDRLQAHKKRNSMLIQLGLLLCDMINWQPKDEKRDNKLENIKYFQGNVKARIKGELLDLEYKFKDTPDIKEAKILRKSINDKKIMLEALNNLEENYLKTGKAKINF